LRVEAKLAGTSDNLGYITNIVIGILGAVIGGFVWRYLAGANFEPSFDLPSLLVAILGGLTISFGVRIKVRDSAADANKSQRARDGDELSCVYSMRLRGKPVHH
jgi:uncharacterized membrane protein YeaQ/YmgE (transglycosylase-associated protein family)